VTVTSVPVAAPVVSPVARTRYGSRRALPLLERNIRLYLRHWVLFISGVAEPLLFLLSIGIGLSGLVGNIRVGNVSVPYATFVAPALLAASSMNGAMIDSIFNVFFKLRITHSYDAVLATPLDTGDVALGELTWAVTRGIFYAATFLVIMAALGDTLSWLVIFTLVSSMLLSASFAAVGMAATTFMRSWQDFDLVALFFIPLFLFSGTFYPVNAYPTWLADLVRITPLYQGVQINRALSLGQLHWALLLNVAYLAVLGAAGYVVASRRLSRLLLP
jgi:lipooligosaccharide transport system permease protein